MFTVKFLSYMLYVTLTTIKHVQNLLVVVPCLLCQVILSVCLPPLSIPDPGGLDSCGRSLLNYSICCNAIKCMNVRRVLYCKYNCNTVEPLIKIKCTLVQPVKISFKGELYVSNVGDY